MGVRVVCGGPDKGERGNGNLKGRQGAWVRLGLCHPADLCKPWGEGREEQKGRLRPKAVGSKLCMVHGHDH